MPYPVTFAAAKMEPECGCSGLRGNPIAWTATFTMDIVKCIFLINSVPVVHGTNTRSRCLIPPLIQQRKGISRVQGRHVASSLDVSVSTNCKSSRKRVNKKWRHVKWPILKRYIEGPGCIQTVALRGIAFAAEIRVGPLGGNSARRFQSRICQLSSSACVHPRKRIRQRVTARDCAREPPFYHQNTSFECPILKRPSKVSSLGHD